MERNGENMGSGCRQRQTTAPRVPLKSSRIRPGALAMPRFAGQAAAERFAQMNFVNPATTAGVSSSSNFSVSATQASWSRTSVSAVLVWM